MPGSPSTRRANAQQVTAPFAQDVPRRTKMSCGKSLKKLHFLYEEHPQPYDALSTIHTVHFYEDAGGWHLQGQEFSNTSPHKDFLKH